MHGTMADGHFFVEASFFGQVANDLNVIGSQFLAKDNHLARVGVDDLVDDAEEGGLTCPVRAE